LGNRIRNLLLNNGHSLVGITHSKQHKNNPESGITYIQIDISKKEEFDKLNGHTFDAIIHTAAYISFENNKESLKKCFDTNILGTLNMLNYARNKDIRHFIYSSSVSVYSENINKILTEENDCSPSSYYSISKLMGEFFCREFQEIDCCIFRYGGMYGNGGNHGVSIMEFLKRILEKRKIILFNKNSSRNYLYVKDAALANLFSIENNLIGTYNIVSDECLKIIEIVRIMAEAFKDYSPQIEHSHDEAKNDLIYDVSKFKCKCRNFPQYSFKRSIYDMKSEMENIL